MIDVYTPQVPELSGNKWLQGGRKMDGKITVYSRNNSSAMHCSILLEFGVWDIMSSRRRPRDKNRNRK